MVALKNKKLVVGFSIVIALLLIAIGLLAYQVWQKQINQPSTYEECIKIPGSLVQESYPAICVAENGKSFVQPLTEEVQNPQFCGSIQGIICPEGYVCNYDGDYPDAGGTCIKN